MPKARLTDRSLAALKPGAVIWDTEVAGLGARKQAVDGRVVFVLKYRSPVERDGTGRGKQRFLTLGRRGRGDLGIDDARKEATALRLQLRAGQDPALARDERKAALTVAELCDLYLSEIETVLVRGRGKKATTLLRDRSNINCHIKPLLGHMAVAAVQPADVRRFMQQVAAGRTAAPRAKGSRGNPATGGKGAASRAVGLLGGIFSYAVREGTRPDNPVRGVERYAYNRRDRRLSDDEYAALGAALRGAEAAGEAWPPSLAILSFLALTGWRSGEARALRWQDVDLARRTATLPDTKTGRSMRPLSRVACDVLRAMQTIRSGELAFPGAMGGPVTAVPRLLGRVVRAAGLPHDVTPHVLRHSFASQAADLGYSEPTIAAMLGHAGRSVTSRYTHLADAPLLAAADAVANRIAALMGEAGERGQVVPLVAAR